jgi:DNA-binding IclR family transcriptional regulator
MPIKVAPNEAEFSQTVVKALIVLECVADADRPLSAAEVAAPCKISRPMAYWLLSTLATRGYVAQVNGSFYREGVRCVGAPIFDRSGRAFAAVSVSGPAYRLPISRLESISTLVIEMTGTISARVGYLPQG